MSASPCATLLVRQVPNECQSVGVSLPATATVRIPPRPVNTWPLQRLGFWPCKLFEFPAVYQPLPIRIPRGRCVEGIGGRGRPLWLLRPGRGNLPPNLPDCRGGYGRREANQ